MFTKRFWADFFERSVRGAAIVLLTSIFVDSWSNAELSYQQKGLAALSGAALSMGLSLLSALRDGNNASFVLSDAPGGDPPAVPNR
jgi:hypothetical protein